MGGLARHLLLRSHGELLQRGLVIVLGIERIKGDVDVGIDIDVDNIGIERVEGDVDVDNIDIELDDGET